VQQGAHCSEREASSPTKLIKVMLSVANVT